MPMIPASNIPTSGPDEFLVGFAPCSRRSWTHSQWRLPWDGKSCGRSSSDLSAVIQAVFSRKEMSRLLPDDSPRSLGVALALGAASSSCSYAAVAIARSLFRKGADFTAAMAFEMASTNLVLELSIILIVLMGWQFMAAEAIAAPIMVAILALLFRKFLTRQLVREAKEQADRGLLGRMEGHAEMDMSVPPEGPLWQSLRSCGGQSSVRSLRSSRSSVRWATFRSRPCYGTGASASAGCSPSSSPT
jgi:uncharacterized membrane protein YraQ (UPF0718 family)